MKKITLFILALSLAASLQAEERHIMTSDSVNLFINVKGTGSPCLYIHGGPGSGSYWMEKFMGDYLEQHFQMIYLDQRGVGRSTSPENNDYSLERMIMDFEEVRLSLGINHWLTLGHSFGGILQMAYVSRNPKSIDAMIFINCCLSLEDSFKKSWLPKGIELSGSDVPDVSMDTSISIYNRMLSLMPVLNEKDSMWKIFFAEQTNNRKMNDSYSNFQSWNSDQSETILELDEYWDDFTIHTSEIQQAVLFFYGKTDWAAGPEHYKKIAFPNMLLWESDAGHMPFLEDKQNLEHAITTFCKRNTFIKPGNKNSFE